MTTVQVRTNEKTKKAAQKVLKELGLDLSSAINLYLVQIVKKKGIPFQIITENGMTLETEMEILKEEREVRKNGKSYPSAKALHKAIMEE